jgi:hypothetical protein
MPLNPAKMSLIGITNRVGYLKPTTERGFKMKHELVEDIVAEFAEFELGSDCTCEVFESEDSENTIPSNECFGCWEDDKDNFKYEILNPWLERNGWTADTLIYVFGANMNWNRVSGWTNVRASELLDSVTLRGDFKLRFLLLEDNSLTCVRSSHDELGALFVFDKAKEAEETP